MYSSPAPTSATSSSESTRQKAIDVNRSLRTIKNELETLLEKGAVTDDAFNDIHSLLPQEWNLRTGPPAATPQPQRSPGLAAPPTAASSQTPSRTASPAHRNEPVHSSSSNNSSSNNDSRNKSRSTAGFARGKYRYEGASEGDLAFERDDHIAVFSKVNDDWWLGKNDRTGQVGIFPSVYVQPDARLVELERSGRMPAAADGDDNSNDAPRAAANDNNSGHYPGHQSYPYHGPPGGHQQQTPYHDLASDHHPPQYDEKYPPPNGQPPGGYYGNGVVQPGPAPYANAPGPAGPVPDGNDKMRTSGKKIGGKLGNAFVTGVGFAAGAELVGAIL